MCLKTIILSYLHINFLNTVTNFHQTWSEHSAFKGQVTCVHAESEGGNDTIATCCTVLRVCDSFVFLGKYNIKFMTVPKVNLASVFFFESFFYFCIFSCEQMCPIYLHVNIAVLRQPRMPNVSSFPFVSSYTKCCSV